MRKYIQVLKITFEEYLVYRLNFWLWRFRAFIQILVLYFLWFAVIPRGTTIFGYDQAKILTYILGTSIVRSFILSSRSSAQPSHYWFYSGGHNFGHNFVFLSFFFAFYDCLLDSGKCLAT